MKTWQAFIVGGVCGVGITLGVAWVVGPHAKESRVNRAGERGLISGINARSEKPDTQVKNVKAGKVEEPEEAPLEERIARLRAWAEGRADKPDAKMVSETLQSWAERDPYAALAFVQGATRFPGRMEAIAIPFAELAKKDSAQALAWLYDNLGEIDRGNVMETAIHRLVDGYAAQSLLLAFADNVPVSRGTIGRILNRLVKTDAPAALSGFEKLSEQGRLEVIDTLVSGWCAVDMAAAERWCVGLQGQPYQDAALANLVELSIERNAVAEAERLIARFPAIAGELSAHSLSMILKHDISAGMRVLKLMDKDDVKWAIARWSNEAISETPDDVLRIINTQFSAGERDEMLGAAFSVWLESDRKAASEWLAVQADSPTKRAMQQGERRRQMEDDPVKAIEALARQPISPGVVEDTSDALSLWAGLNPQAAAHWVTNNPQRASLNAIAQVTRSYLERDEASGATWLASLPSGAERDRAASEAAEFWSERREINFATEAARSVTNPEIRVRALFSIYRTLQSSQPDQAKAWMAAQDISPENQLLWRALGSDGGPR